MFDRHCGTGLEQKIIRVQRKEEQPPEDRLFKGGFDHAETGEKPIDQPEIVRGPK